MAIVRTTVSAHTGDFKSNISPYTTSSISVAASAMVVVTSIMDYDTCAVTNSGTARTWTRAVATTGPGDGKVFVDYWYNNTGSSVNMTITVTFTSSFNPACMVEVAALTGVADPASVAPIVTTQIGNITSVAATGSPTIAGSLMMFHFVNRSPTSALTTLYGGTTYSSSPISQSYIAGLGRAGGVLYQTMVNYSPGGSITLGATAPTAQDTSGALIEYPPVPSVAGVAWQTA